MSEFNFSVTLAQATGKGLAVSYDGTLCESGADTFAGITISSGSNGDIVAVGTLGSELYFINCASAVTAGQPLQAAAGGGYYPEALSLMEVSFSHMHNMLAMIQSQVVAG